MSKNVAAGKVQPASRVFLSYARADGLDAVVTVQKELECNGFEVWRDLRNLDTFNDFSVEIERAIEATDLFVVVLTSSIAASPDSFVRREILYAQSKHKRIVPIRIGTAPVPILINHLTWIEVSSPAGLTGMLADELRRRAEFTGDSQSDAIAPAADVRFVRGLLDDIVDYLDDTATILLDIASSGQTSRPGSARGGLPGTMQPLRQSKRPSSLTPGALGQRCAKKTTHTILRGAPGSGKTTALLVAAREAANTWLEGGSERLPVFCRAADWNALDDESVLAWMDRSTPLLPTEVLEQLLTAGRVALFVDGLDELPALITRPPRTVVNPRQALLDRLPQDISILITSRPGALHDIGMPVGYEPFDLEPISDIQIAAYLSASPGLAELIGRSPDLRELMQTPLTLGLLSFMAAEHDQDDVALPPPPELSARLAVIHGFTISRWRHEAARAGDLVASTDLVDILGRTATRHGQYFSGDDLRDASEQTAAEPSDVLGTATLLNLIRPVAESEFAFFHPSFAEYYATMHCHRYLGEESSDGYDVRLFQRIAQLGDDAFAARLTAMSGSGFWRGEYCDEISHALNAIGSPENPDVVAALVHLAGYPALGFQGINAVGAFARRCPAETLDRFIDRFRPRVKQDFEVVHQLLGMGEPGIDAVLQEYRRLDRNDPMRAQIESYSVIQQRL